MVFSSLLFVFAFLPLNLCFYYLAKSTPVQNAVMLVFSLVFYAWGEPKYVLLLVAMTFIDWLFSLAAEKGRGKKTAEIALVCACIA
ncbi:MAG: MBOAT family protein, partial [Clostridia bacterium]|nr:MBOAT family protein [Clostridia bacterium]